jgi:cell shape-determining protein MreC
MRETKEQLQERLNKTNLQYIKLKEKHNNLIHAVENRITQLEEENTTLGTMVETYEKSLYTALGRIILKTQPPLYRASVTKDTTDNGENMTGEQEEKI